ncbi:MAG TPA: hypothetical protein VLY87_06470 [Flavobacterium sp.]|nr:hypothetical protein [Flavobacterium sp.]
MNRKIVFYTYIFLILSVLLLGCLYKSVVIDEVYGRDFYVYDTKSIESEEPEYLKEIDDPLEPMSIFWDKDDVTIWCPVDYVQTITINVDDFSNQKLLNTIDKTIDSVKFNNLKNTNIHIVLNKQTSYQTFIDILDVFDKKQSLLYGVVKDTVFWIE